MKQAVRIGVLVVGLLPAAAMAQMSNSEWANHQEMQRLQQQRDMDQQQYNHDRAQMQIEQSRRDGDDYIQHQRDLFRSRWSD